MAIPINIEDLLNKRKIESNRIEFKKGWNPDKIYRTICAFANDFDNIGGGYIVVGIEEEERTGIAKRPVTGVPIEALNDIQKDMVGYNNKIEPYYMPRIDVQEVDGKSVLVIWAPAGVNRPYNVRERVTAKQSPSNGISAAGQVPLRQKARCLTNSGKWLIGRLLMKEEMSGLIFRIFLRLWFWIIFRRWEVVWQMTLKVSHLWKYWIRWIC